MTEHAVVIAGGGPTGLMLAGELALAGPACIQPALDQVRRAIAQGRFGAETKRPRG